MIESATKFLIEKIYATSPYSWLDRWLEGKANAEKDHERIGKITKKRLVLSECYILGWLGLAIFFLAINQWLSTLLVYILMLRVIGILNKELGVVLFGIAKITKGSGVSSSARVIVLSLINYSTAGLLFALLYTKEGTYQLNSTTVSPLPTSEAILQGLSILVTLSPAYAPLDFQTNIITIAQGAFCFLFVILIISSFVSNLIRMNSTKNANPI